MDYQATANGALQAAAYSPQMIHKEHPLDMVISRLQQHEDQICHLIGSASTLADRLNGPSPEELAGQNASGPPPMPAGYHAQIGVLLDRIETALARLGDHLRRMG